MSQPTEDAPAKPAYLLRAKLESEAKAILSKSVRECIEYVLSPNVWNPETCILRGVCEKWLSLSL